MLPSTPPSRPLLALPLLPFPPQSACEKREGEGGDEGEGTVEGQGQGERQVGGQGKGHGKGERDVEGILW